MSNAPRPAAPIDIRIADRAVHVDGQPTLLFGGEFHYFRVDPAHWESILATMKAGGINLVSTYVPWLYHEDVEGQIDFTGQRAGTRDLPRFLRLVAEAGMLCLVRPGPYIMSELVNEGLPDWIYSAHPQVLARTLSGQPHPTRVVSYLNAEFIALADRWLRAFIDATRPYYVDRGGPIAMLQLDNEVGMLQWVTNNADYSPDALQRFLALSPQPDIADDAELLDVLRDPDDPRNTPALFNRFVESFRDQFADYLRRLREPFLEAGIDVPLVVNVHGFHQVEYAKRATLYPIGLSQLARTVEIPDAVLAGDYYIGNAVWENYPDLILANLITAAVQNPDHPLFSAEFQSGFQTSRWRAWPSTYALTSKLCFGYGMNAINYYMYVGGFNPPGTALMGAHHDWQAPIGEDLARKRQYETLTEFAAALHALGPEFLASTYRASAWFGLDLDYYRTEYTNAATAPIAGTIQGDRTTVIFDGIVASLLRLNHNLEAVDLRINALDVRRHRRAVVFSSDYMAAATQRRVLDFLAAGGQVLLTPKVPTQDLDGNPCTLLADALGIAGIQANAVRFIDTATVRCAGDRSTATQSYSFTDPTAVTPFAFGAQGWDDPEAVVGFTRDLGAGHIIVLGSALSYDHLFKTEITREIAGMLGWRPDVEVEPGVELDGVVRAIEGGARYTFLANYLGWAQTTTITADGVVRFGGHPITLAPRESVILVEDAPVAGLQVLWATGELRLVEDEVSLHGSSDPLRIASPTPLAFDAHFEETVRSGPGAAPRYEYAIANPGRPVAVAPAQP